ncbi:MAG: mtsF [Myxococcaceae bacterium]|nr:mtsF [Myxococcaceae bacterium]
MKTSWLLIAPAVLLFACPPPPKCNPEEEDCGTDAGPPPDVCNTRDEALTLAECEIPLRTTATSDAGVMGYLSVAMDQDWYMVKMPTLSARSLVHISAGYGAPSTPVNLAVSVLKEDGTTGIARKIDRHGAAAPKPVDIIFPYAESNAKLLIVLADEALSNKAIFDVRNQYAVSVDVFDNPDANEPNDTVPTQIPLTASGAMLTGQAKGALATDNDVDKYTFAAPAGRKVLYLHLTMPKLTPQALSRVSYTLFDPTGKPVAEGTALNEFVPVDLATARLVSMGDYTLDVRGYKAASSTAVTQGDLRMLYTVDVQIMDDLDVNEPNDTQLAPKVVPLAYGASASFTGRLGYVPDPDIFALDLAATGSAGVIRYRLVLNAGAPRFAPLAPASDRQLRIVNHVTAGGPTVADKRVACKTNATVCPKGYEGSAQNQALVEALCDTQDPPWCLWMERTEDRDFTNLRNMAGSIPVPAHGAPARYFLYVQDEGTDYADDRDYTIFVSYEADPDDTTRAAQPFETVGAALAENASFPVPAGAGVSGVLSHGYGRVLENRIDRGEGVRAASDYDAVPTDYDRFEFTLPAVTPPPDRSWALQWEIGHNDAGSPPSDLTLEVTFCTTATTADGGCGGTPTAVLAFSPDRIQPWYGQSLSDRGIL